MYSVTICVEPVALVLVSMKQAIWLSRRGRRPARGWIDPVHFLL
jgi:hypothetical protein